MNEISALERLVAIEAIKTLRARYCRCLDTKDWVGLRDVLASNIRLELPSLASRGGITGIEDFLAVVQQWFGASPSLHANYLPEIEIVSPTQASAIWAQEHFIPARYRPGEHHGHGYGYSHDRYERVDGVWLIASIRLEPRFELE
jgi:hypothetical protein